MNTISELMTHDHRDCDGIFARAEELASDGDWADAAAALKKFADALNAHFAAEESTLFPAFEARTGMTSTDKGANSSGWASRRCTSRRWATVSERGESRS